MISHGNPRVKRALLGCFLLASLASLLGQAGCGGLVLAKTGHELLERAEARLDSGNPGSALVLLESVSEESFDEQDLARYKLNLAKAHFKLEDYYQAFHAIKDFPRDFPASPLLPQVAEIEFQAGHRLAASGYRLFLGLASDLDDATEVLEHLLIYHPASQHIDDALRILGEAAYLNEDYELAIERYSELLQRVRNSHWADMATFRVAMSQYQLLTGPDYDAAALETAQRELVGFLRSGSKNNEFVDEARLALARTELWIEQKELQIAKYYLTLGNDYGARIHLEQILKKADAQLRKEAAELLRQMAAKK